MADNREDFISFDRALDELRLSEEQLKRLVSEGEIRAIRGEHNTMRFKREEIDRLKQDTGKTIQYTEESSDTLTDDLLFDENDDLQIEDEGMATAQISSEDTFVADEPPAAMAQPPVTRAIRTSHGRGSRPSTGSSAPAPTSKTPRPATASLRRTTGRSTRMRAMDSEKVSGGIGPAMLAALVVTFIIGIFSMMVYWDIAKDRVGSATKGIVEMAGESFADITPAK